MSKWLLTLLLLAFTQQGHAWTDSDLDGVPDLKDACAGTPDGLKVFANGCSKMPLSDLCLPTDVGGQYPDTCASASHVSVHFPTGSAQLPQSQWPVLADIARFLKTYPKAHLLLAGHTDATGTNNINLPLSLARANAVKLVLSNDYSIGAERLRVSGEGSSMPVASSVSRQANYLNRRVNFVITQQAQVSR